MNYNSKVKSMLKRILSEQGFVYCRGNAFIRNKNDVPQSIVFEKSRLWDSIWISIFSNLNSSPYYTDDRYISEYFFASDEDFYKKLVLIEQEFREKWIPYLNRKAEEYNITTFLMKEYNEKTDEYAQKALKNDCFPENIDELINVVKKIYHGKAEFDKTQKDEAICMVASLYWGYLIKNYPEYKPFGGECHPKCLISKVLFTDRIDPLQTAYTSFATKDYDEFKSGKMIWDIQENSVWIKEKDWVQKIY